MRAFNPQPLACTVWRAVEAQHLVSTMPLVDNNLDDQRVLEEILDASKPPVPPSARHLHWLLATPFRYPPHPTGSRFRGRYDPGTFYGAFERRTALAEFGFWRWRFIRDSTGLNTQRAHPIGVFEADIAIDAVDLRASPWAGQAEQWTHPHDYHATQAFAQAAREANVGCIVYESVRDPQRGGCVAVLRPEAFLAGQQPQTQTWYLTVTATQAIFQQADAAHAFDFSVWMDGEG